MTENHPIMITLRDVISGDNFLAGITLSGRTLMRNEDGKWWMYGVRPAAIAESGLTIEEAFSRFRNRYKELLFDLAEENTTFEDFRTAVEQFFFEADADSEDERLWEEALKDIRTSRCVLPAPFSSLPREAPESKPSQITVELLSRADARFKPSDNVTDTYSMPTSRAA